MYLGLGLHLYNSALNSQKVQVPAVHGSAAFNGSSYIEVSPSSAFNMTLYWTIEFWVKADRATTGTDLWTIMCQNFDPSPYPIDIFLQNGKLIINNGRDCGAEPPPGVWTHVAITCNGGGNDLNIYYNGTNVYNGGGWYLTDSTEPLRIGKRGPGDFQYFNGKITNVRITNQQEYTGDFTPSILPVINASHTSLLWTPTDQSLTTDTGDNNLTITDHGATYSSDYPEFYTYTTIGLALNLDAGTAPATGTNWVDKSGTYTATIRKSGSGNFSYTATNSGGITTTGTTGINGAMIATNYDLPLTHTLEIVASITDTNYWSSLFGNETYGSKGFLGYFGSSTAFNVGGPTGGETYAISSATRANINHYIITTTAAGVQKLYLNGQLLTKSGGSYVQPATLSTSGLQIGARHPNAGTANTVNDPADGTYYMVRAYNRALNQTEVTKNYNAIKTLYGI